MAPSTRAIENRHCQGSIAKIFRPSFEVDIRDQGRGTLRTAAIDQFVEQAGRLGRFASFDFIEAEFVDDQQLEVAPIAEPLRQAAVGQRSHQIGEQVGARHISHAVS